MRAERVKGFLSGVLTAALVVGLVGTAAATVGKRTAELDYSNIQITLNGKKVTPKDAAGNAVEPFAIDGTTYLPVRAVGDALGLKVGWDEKSRTVQLDDEAKTGEADDVGDLFRAHALYVLAEMQEETINNLGVLRRSLLNRASSKEIEDGITFAGESFDNAHEYMEMIYGLYGDTSSFTDIFKICLDAETLTVDTKLALLDYRKSGTTEDFKRACDSSLNASAKIWDAEIKANDLFYK